MRLRRTVDELLTPHLKGKALSQYSALDEDSDYDEVCDLMRLRTVDEIFNTTQGKALSQCSALDEDSDYDEVKLEICCQCRNISSENESY